MFEITTQTLLEKSLPSLPLLVMENSLARDIDDLLAGIMPGAKWAVVDDPNTCDTFGDRVFKATGGGSHITFDRPPQADEAAVEYVRQKSKSCDAIAAVGSGTINDICKYAAYLDNKPYVVFPTAASMNGYLSANASVSFAGYKKTCKTVMPKAVFCDLSVISSSPARLSKSGLGDCLARPTAQADWLLSHLWLGTHYDETPFQLLAPYEPQLFESAAGVARRDKETLALLMKTLLLSGLGMSIAKGSHPASQAEHMLAHAYEMRVSSSQWQVENKNISLGTRHSALATLHGEAIGVTTLFMARMQERLLRGKPRLREDNFPEEKIAAMFGDKVMEEAKKAFATKQALLSSTADRRPLAPGIAARIEKIMVSSARVAAILKAAELPQTIEALGWEQTDYNEITAVARFLRERFTFLDLIAKPE